jgi:hypothetical protein
LAPDEIKEWESQKQLLIDKDMVIDFARDISLNYEEVVTERKLDSLREKMLEEDPCLLQHDFRTKIDKILKSPLYKCLYRMPKPAIHHLHMTATVSTDFLLELTYDWRVLYSKTDNLFKVSADENFSQPGYIRVSKLRNYWKDAQEFDDMLKHKMSLRPAHNHREDHKIWEDFQYKFSLTFELYSYKHFFEKILYRSMKDYIKEQSTIVEIRHIFGCLFNDDGPVSLEDELKLFEDMQKNIQNFTPLFQMRLIATGLKIVGRDQIKS